MNNITYPERRGVYIKALAAYGPEALTVIAIEELSELIKELCKQLRDGKSPVEPVDPGAMADELADATIMIEQMREMYGLQERVCERMDYKIGRLASRVEAAHEI